LYFSVGVDSGFVPTDSSLHNFPGFLIFLEAIDMPNEFDPYREALVMEHATFWPETYDDWELADRARVESALHANPKECADLTYLRQHTGFCRQIKVTDADLERLAAR
jgi:hypothetical protein